MHHVVGDTCSRFPGLECSYACRQRGHSSTSGMCFCESGRKLDSDGKTCIGDYVMLLGFYSKVLIIKMGLFFEIPDHLFVINLKKKPHYFEDINECRDESPCSHNCTNIEGGFECGCAVGYRLENDGVSCESKNLLFASFQYSY